MRHPRRIVLGLMLTMVGWAWSAPDAALPEGKPEHGHGLSAGEAAAGWISLFDGCTDFGWEGARVEGGVLRGGKTAVRLGPCAVRADLVRGGTITLGGKERAVKAGAFSLKDTGASGRVVLGEGVAVRSLVVRPVGLRTILPGEKGSEGLPAGWKRIDHPRLPRPRRAEWKMDGGILRARGGPGALEYAGKFGDLVLQVEARSRARHANGGVFFRSVPGDFMNGYEAQIYSRCEGDDPSRPARYATGGLDDRQNARRLVSRDFSSFVMTVIADGPRLATWVNGHQVTSWTDMRKPHPNPRQGLRTEPGTLQLQAHDAKTDLEFRKVAVGELR
jgi:hypothetical protein